VLLFLKLYFFCSFVKLGFSRGCIALVLKALRLSRFLIYCIDSSSHDRGYEKAAFAPLFPFIHLRPRPAAALAKVFTGPAMWRKNRQEKNRQKRIDRRN
jgi:hypothetical protein